MKAPLRSEVCTYDMASGWVCVVLQSAMLVEAPNWTPDGSALIVNAEGLLWRVPLDEPEMQPIDTGFATRLNNDHGLSPDGRTIAISNHTVPGFSCIYTVPARGGEPVQITANTPSWWHGWSPDGARLAYTARRGAEFDIYTIPAEGGVEDRITSGGGHHDGPDYTPDGKWIWFNSDQVAAADLSAGTGTDGRQPPPPRTGRETAERRQAQDTGAAAQGAMDLWRIRPDGTDRQRMTDDAGVNWFPHPSPDGLQVLYLAYPEGTRQHPRDLEVELRIMPAAGGASRLVLPIFGGQGSINVPCWSPDGRAFAFVRYFPEP